MRCEAEVIALRCVVMMEKWRAPSIIRNAMRRQLWSTTASETLQPSSFAFATPASIILRLPSWVSRWVATTSGMVRFLAMGRSARHWHGTVNCARAKGLCIDSCEQLACAAVYWAQSIWKARAHGQDSNLFPDPGRRGRLLRRTDGRGLFALEEFPV